MKMLWCWRCKTEVPMLDDFEYEHVMSQIHPSKTTREQIFRDFLLEYERLTGIHETNPSTVFHHRWSMYGPPCRFCGKPLRTPKSTLCGHCMKFVQRN